MALLANPWRQDRPSDRFPAIVQDVTVIALFMVIGTVLLREQLLTTSAVGAVVVGFALQDTLGNLFAGLAIQIEKPFRVGQWVQFGDREGQVQEITWRATKLRTKAGQFLIVPNSVISKEPVLNHSEPTVPTRIEVEIGASYSVAAERRQARDAGSDGQFAAGDEGAGAAGRDQELWRVGDRLRRAVLDRGLRDRSDRARPGAHQSLVHVPPPQHRDPVSDPDSVRAHRRADPDRAPHRQRPPITLPA